jgi:hypothetical protein
MEGETRNCSDDGFKLIKYDATGGVYRDGRNAWREMCDECLSFINGGNSKHLGLKANSGSKRPPIPAENNFASKQKGRRIEETK